MLRAKRGCAAQGRQLVSDLLPLARAAGGAWHSITAGAPHLTLAHVYVSIHEDLGLPGGAAEAGGTAAPRTPLEGAGSRPSRIGACT